jgi:hypothetical protein
MGPELLPGERRVRLRRVADKAAGGVGVEGQQEGHEQVVGVPEGLEGLLADAMVRGGVDQHHAEQHDMAGDAAGLGEVYLDGRVTAKAPFLDVVEAAWLET